MLRKQIVEVGKLLYEKDLTCATSGNISVKTDDGIFITASGTALGFLKLNEIVLLDYDGNILAGGRPSIEKMLHVEIYKQRPDVRAIIHTHPVNLTTFATCHEPLNAPIMSENILYFEDIPVAPYAMLSSQELVYYTCEYLKNRDVVLMANHGAIAIAESLEKAFLKMETAEYYAKVTLNTKILGNPKHLSEKDVQDLINLKNSK
ncbi:class II aldolase/adducin family protein [bacterium]|nr:class II aldolase/adducin family protein [bacterium]